MWKFVVIAFSAFMLVAHCQFHSETEIKKSESEFLVPNIPKPLEDSTYGTSRFVFIWANRLHQRNQTGSHLRSDDPNRPEPALIVIPTEFQMLNLVPQDAPHPLYSIRFTELTDDFLLDSMSTEYVDPADNRISAPEGLTVKTRTGKDLLFKKDLKTGVLTVNGITIETVTRIPGDVKLTVFDSDGLLFEYLQKVDDAFRILARDAANHPNHPLLKPKSDGGSNVPRH